MLGAHGQALIIHNWYVIFNEEDIYYEEPTDCGCFIHSSSHPLATAVKSGAMVTLFDGIN